MRDSRVWRYFFKNLAWPFGAAAYVIAVVVGSAYADNLSEGLGTVVVVLFIALPVLTYLIRDMWRDAKEKVDRENEEVMRILRK